MKFISHFIVVFVFAIHQSHGLGVDINELGQKTISLLSDICPSARAPFFEKGLCLLRNLKALPKICKPIKIFGKCDGPIIQELSACNNKRSNDLIIHLNAVTKTDAALCENGDEGIYDLYEEYGPQCVSESLLSCSNPLLPIINDFFQGTVESPTFYTPDNCRKMSEIDCTSQLKICSNKNLVHIRKMHKAYLNATCGPTFIN